MHWSGWDLYIPSPCAKMHITKEKQKNTERRKKEEKKRMQCLLCGIRDKRPAAKELYRYPIVVIFIIIILVVVNFSFYFGAKESGQTVNIFYWLKVLEHLTFAIIPIEKHTKKSSSNTINNVIINHWWTIRFYWWRLFM